MRLYLKDGVTPEQAIMTLTDRIGEAKNVGPSVAPQSFTRAGVADRMTRLRDAYLAWTEGTKVQLTNVTRDSDVLRLPFTTAYYEIRQFDGFNPRGIAFIESEIARQIRSLEAVRDDLSRRRERALSAEGHITNVLLHYEPPDSVNWSEVVGHATIRLVVPLRVIEELDTMKYTARDKLRDRARSVLTRLRQVVGRDGAPGTLPSGATIEVFIEPGPRDRPNDADAELLQTAHELRRLSGREVTLVTADSAMQMRAETEGITTAVIDDKYRREKEAAAE